MAAPSCGKSTTPKGLEMRLSSILVEEPRGARSRGGSRSLLRGLVAPSFPWSRGPLILFSPFGELAIAEAIT
jgi:hypothetical protein